MPVARRDSIECISRDADISAPVPPYAAEKWIPALAVQHWESAVRRLRIGINGFGRIGRTIFRILREQNLFDVTVINDINPDSANLAYQLRYDSVRGVFPGTIVSSDKKLIVNGHDIAVYTCAQIADVPWGEHVDVLIDSSGVRENMASIARTVFCIGSGGHYIHTHAVLATNFERRRDFRTITEKVRTVVFGANEAQFDPANDKLISSSICDTIALGPIIKVLEDAYGIESGSLTTLHPWLGDQNLMDGNPDPRRTHDNMQSHFALGRSAINNLIPKSTTAVMAADAIFPLLSQKLESFSYRVPTDIVASAVLNVSLVNEAEQAELIERFYRFEREQKWSIISNTVEPMVSTDYSGSAFSTTIDHRWTVLKRGRNLRLVYWYDNEWGYSSRVVDIVKLIARR